MANLQIMFAILKVMYPQLLISHNLPMQSNVDMVKLGQRYEVCPYYMSKELQGGADIIFMPYNYLVDPEIRKSLTISLADSVLIFDEAHNLEGICGDAASFDLTAGMKNRCAFSTQEITSGEGVLGLINFRGSCSVCARGTACHRHRSTAWLWRRSEC